MVETPFVKNLIIDKEKKMITPIYEILRDDQNITDIFKDKLISLTIVDKIGDAADTLDITLDFDGSYATPRASVVLEVKIGYSETGLWEVGSFYVMETKLAGGADLADTLSIRATSIPFTPLTAVKSLGGSHDRVWQSHATDGTTLKTIVDEVCAAAGLTAKIDPTLAKIPMPYIRQVEPDAEFLRRLTDIYDAIVKFHEGQVIIEQKDSGKIGALNIKRTGKITNYEFLETERHNIGSVVSRYQDIDAGEVVKYTAGEGEPVKDIQTTFPDRVTAVHAAESVLKHEKRKKIYANITMPTEAGLLAEKIINLSDFPDASNNGEYIIESVTHRFHNTAGLSSTIKARQRG